MAQTVIAHVASSIENELLVTYLLQDDDGVYTTRTESRDIATNETTLVSTGTPSLDESGNLVATWWNQ